MKIEEFMSLILNNDIDRYPDIRESIIKNWTIREMLIALGKIDYKVTHEQLEKFIKFKEGNNTHITLIGSVENLCSDNVDIQIVKYEDGRKYVSINPIICIPMNPSTQPIIELELSNEFESTLRSALFSIK